MINKNIFIQTIGCQMNVYDSDQMFRLLRPMGYKKTSSIKEADLILVNTCAIREKAEQKVFSFLGRLLKYKNKNPHLIIAVGGCVAQQEGNKIRQRAPFVDLVFGTHAFCKLPEMIASLESAKNDDFGITDIDFVENIDDLEFESSFFPITGISDFVTIMRGCDNYCSYCVVPYVRGREMSRKPEIILQEIKEKVDRGIREIILLGQNVNSYGKKEGLCSFSQLLYKINEIKGLKRIRFTTSHPKDLSKELIIAFGEIDKLCNHIHLPVQSGSDKILKKMNRKYTRKDYSDKLNSLRKVCPDIAITSDFIVGFPGENEEDFQETLSLIKEIEYDSLFAFQYSDRPVAISSKFLPKVDEEIKNKRLNQLLEFQASISENKSKKFLGTIQKVLVEGISKKGEQQWTGRASNNRIVNFTSPEPVNNLRGQELDVEIIGVCAHSLKGISQETS